MSLNPMFNALRSVYSYLIPIMHSKYGGITTILPPVFLVIIAISLIAFIIIFRVSISRVKKIVVSLILVASVIGFTKSIPEFKYKTIDWYLNSLPNNTVIVVSPYSDEDMGSYQVAVDNGYIPKIDAVVNQLKDDGYVDHIVYAKYHITDKEGKSNEFYVDTIDGLQITDDHLITGISDCADDEDSYIGTQITDVPAIIVVSREMDEHYYTFTTTKKAVVQWDNKVTWLDKAYNTLKKGSNVKVK